LSAQSDRLPEPREPDSAVEAGRSRRGGWKGLFGQREVMTLGLIVLASLAFHMLTLSSRAETWPSKYANTSHLLTFIVPLSSEAIVTVGMLLVIVGGGFDLSVGSVLALSEIACAAILRHLYDPTTGTLPGYAVPLAFACGIGVGCATGSMNAFVITRFGVNPLIATLGTMSVARGLAKWVVSKYGVLTGLPPQFTGIGQKAWIFGADGKYQLSGYQIFFIAIVVIVIGDIVLRNSRWFRQIYYVGGNETAARLSGINVDRVRGVTYILCGCLAGLAGVLSCAKYGAANGDSGMGLELQAIAGCVIGGASLAGGVGTVLGAVLGCALMTAVYKGLVCCNVDPTLQHVARGLVLVAAVTLDMWVVRKRKNR
jgi:ribose transport system permease protein